MSKEVKTRFYFVLLACILMSLYSNYVSGAEKDQLEKGYKEQYDSNSNEIKSLQALVVVYDNLIEKMSLLQGRMNDINIERGNYNITEREALKRKVDVTKEAIAAMTETRDKVNVLKGEHLKDISIGEMTRDKEYSQKRIKELNDKKQELKIKILERRGTLPNWWIE